MLSTSFGSTSEISHLAKSPLMTRFQAAIRTKLDSPASGSLGIMVTGLPGCGKSTFINTALWEMGGSAEVFNGYVDFISMEHVTKSLLPALQCSGLKKKSFTVVVVEEVNGIPMFQTFLQLLDKLKGQSRDHVKMFPTMPMLFVASDAYGARISRLKKYCEQTFNVSLFKNAKFAPSSVMVDSGYNLNKAQLQCRFGTVDISNDNDVSHETVSSIMGTLRWPITGEKVPRETFERVFSSNHNLLNIVHDHFADNRTTSLDMENMSTIFSDADLLPPEYSSSMVCAGFHQLEQGRKPQFQTKKKLNGKRKYRTLLYEAANLHHMSSSAMMDVMAFTNEFQFLPFDEAYQKDHEISIEQCRNLNNRLRSLFVYTPNS